MKVFDLREKFGQRPEFPVDVDLLEMRLSQALGIVSIFLVGTVEQSAVPVGDELPRQGDASLLLLVEAKLVCPLIRRFVSADAHKHPQLGVPPGK